MVFVEGSPLKAIHVKVESMEDDSLDGRLSEWDEVKDESHNYSTDQVEDGDDSLDGTFSDSDRITHARAVVWEAIAGPSMSDMQLRDDSNVSTPQEDTQY